MISKLLTFVAIAYAARVAGPAGFGYLEFAASAVLLAGLLVHQGFGLYGAREIAKDPDSTERLVAGIVGIRYVLALLGYLALIVLVLLLDRPPILEQLILLYGLSLFVMPMALHWVFQGHERMNAVAGLQITRQMVFAIVVLVLLRDPLQLWPLAIAEVAAVAAVALGSIWLYRKHFGKHVPRPGRASIALIREATVIGLGRVFWTVRVSGAMVVLGLIAAEQELGYFGSAMRILVGLLVFVWLYYINLLPSFSRAWLQGRSSLEDLLDRSMHLVGWLSLGAGALWILLSPLAVRLVYGNEFLPAVPALQMLALACVAAGIHGHYRFALLAAGRQHDEMVTSACGTLVALPIIPVGYALWGIVGVAGALVAGELVVWWTAWRFVRRSLGIRSTGRYLIVPAVASTTLLVVGWLLYAGGLSLAVVAPGVAVALGGFAFIVDPRARRELGALMAGRSSFGGGQ